MQHDEITRALRDVFHSMDADGNARLDKLEFAKFIAEITDGRAEHGEVMETFAMLDANGDGWIDFDEFLAWWNR